jgi:hypothetical protein
VRPDPGYEVWGGTTAEEWSGQVWGGVETVEWLLQCSCISDDNVHDDLGLDMLVGVEWRLYQS